MVEVTRSNVRTRDSSVECFAVPEDRCMWPVVSAGASGVATR